MSYFGSTLRRPGTFTWEICERCRGNGKVDHPAFSNGITSDEWNEWDYEDREAYLEGRYDVPCPAKCEGGKVRMPIIKACTFSERRELVESRRRAWVDREIERDSRCERMFEDSPYRYMA